ncbi:MAG: hypothetical protein EBS05_22245, partial [Proteobacteria bacterium]|nr:hypothetical protein [Pseudomonadota bacterium]
MAVEGFEELAAVLEEGFPQAQFHGLQIGHTLLGQALGHQLQERGGFAEPLVGDRLRGEFLLLLGGWAGRSVSCSLRVTNCSASAWKRRWLSTSAWTWAACSAGTRRANFLPCYGFSVCSCSE